MKKLVTLILVLAGIVGTASADSYTVAGSEDLLGASWSTEESAGNDMTLKSGTIYTLTRDITGLAAGTYNFKIALNHSWTTSYGEDGGDGNNWVDVAEGCTSVTFVFDSESHNNYAFTDKSAYSIQGDLDGWTEDHDMTRSEDLYTYTYEWKDFEATAKTYEYKVRFDHAWDHSVPAGSDNNKYQIKEAGLYDIKFVFNRLTKELTMSAKKVINIGDYGYATFSSASNAYNFSGTGIDAYYVSELHSSYAKLSSIDDVPLGNGVILKASKGRYTVPFGTAEGSISGNMLWAATSETPVDDVFGGGAYILYHGEFHPASAGSSIPAGKAYIRKGDIPGEAHSLTFIFDDDEVTSIDEMKNETKIQTKDYFNLSGQRVMTPTKGLYIVNGKKFVVK